MSTTTTQREQTDRALERANRIRFARAALRRRIARGEVRAVDVITDPPEEAQTWAIADVLMAQRRWGIDRTRRLLGRLGIPEIAELGGPPRQANGHRGLTDRQRALLARALGQGGEDS